jgi:hypothetical protein
MGCREVLNLESPKHIGKIQKLSSTLDSGGNRAQRAGIFLQKIMVAALSWSLPSANLSFAQVFRSFWMLELNFSSFLNGFVFRTQKK